MSEQRSLDEITSDLGVNHEVSKTSEKELAASRTEFFDAATYNLEKGTLAKTTVEVTLDKAAREAPEEYVKTWYPGWRFVKMMDDLGPTIKIQIEEDPALMKFVHVNRDDEKVYQRTPSQGNPSLDDELLIKKDPDLWQRVSVPIGFANEDLLYEFAKGYDLESEFLKWVEAKRESESWMRILLPLDDLSDKDLAAIQEYMVPAPIKLTLTAPRKAKSEELDA